MADPPGPEQSDDVRPAASPTVVVGYDGSDPAEGALAYATRRAGPQGRIVVVHAVDPRPELGERGGSRRVLEQELERGRRLLGDLPAANRERLETRVLEGPTAEALVHVAREVGAAKLAVGSRRLGRFRAALGSVCHALLKRADRPFAVVPPSALEVAQRPRPLRKVVQTINMAAPCIAACTYPDGCRRSRLLSATQRFCSSQSTTKWIVAPQTSSSAASTRTPCQTSTTTGRIIGRLFRRR